MNRPKTVREIRIPSSLKGATKEKIVGWARSELHGQEPLLTAEDIRAIRDQTRSTVVLRPKKKGFFLGTPPNVRFIETFEHATRFGEDLHAAAEKFDEEARIRKWIDEANALFKKDIPKHEKTRAMWIHGKRIAEFTKETGIALYTLQGQMSKRADLSSYTLRANQTASKFYQWKSNAAEDDPVFQLDWQLVDAVLAFSKDSSARDAALACARELDILGLTRAKITYFLRGAGKKNPKPEWSTDLGWKLTRFRERLLNGDTLGHSDYARLAAAISEFT